MSNSLLVAKNITSERTIAALSQWIYLQSYREIALLTSSSSSSSPRHDAAASIYPIPCRTDRERCNTLLQSRRPHCGSHKNREVAKLKHKYSGKEKTSRYFTITTCSFTQEKVSLQVTSRHVLECCSILFTFMTGFPPCSECRNYLNYSKSARAGLGAVQWVRNTGLLGSGHGRALIFWSAD